MNKKERDTTPEEFNKRRSSAQEGGNWGYVPGIIYRIYCTDCGEKCDYENRHR